MQEEYIRQVFETSPVAFAYYEAVDFAECDTSDYQLVAVNQAYLKLFGVKREEVEGTRGSNRKDGEKEAAAVVANLFRTALFESIPAHGELYDSNQKKSICVTAIPLHSNAFYCLFSDSEKFESAGKKDDDLDGFFDVSPDLLSVIDHDANLVKVNRAWSTLLGYSREELENRHLAELVHPDDRDRTLTTLANLASQQRISGFVNRYLCRNGSFRTIEWFAACIGNQSYSSGRDITKRINDETRLRKNLELQEKHLELMVSKQHNLQEFLGSAFHLFKTVTQSDHVYLYEYNGKAKRYDLYAFSGENEKVERNSSKIMQFYKKGGDLLCEPSVTIGKPYYENWFTSDSEKCQPDQCVWLKNYLSVPVYNENRLAAVIGVANKPEDYNDDDLMNLNLIANTVWTMIQRIQSETLLEQERELFFTTLFSVMEGIIVTDNHGKIRLMNKTAEDLTGFHSSEAIGRPFETVFLNIEEKTGKKRKSPIRFVLKNGENHASVDDEVLMTKSGEQVRVMWTAAGLLAENGMMSGAVVSFRDISKEYLQEKEIEGFLNINLDMLCITDQQGRFIRVNKKFEEVIGYKQKELEGKHLLDYIHEDDLESTKATLLEVHENEQQKGFSCRCRRKDGTYRHIEWHVEMNRDYLFGSARDITEKSNREEELLNMAVLDELTGIYNRHFFEQKIEDLIEKSDQFGEPISLILFDIDNFKRINDEYGHPEGDRVLQLLTSLVSDVLRKSDIFIRFGGEEFVILMPGTPSAGALIAAEKIRSRLESNNDRVIGVFTASFGVCERSDKEAFQSWYKNADDALYHAKKSGKNKVVDAQELNKVI